MKRHLLVVAAYALCSCRTAPPAVPTGDDVSVIYVATTGDDRWTGQLPAPGSHGDGPLATLVRARDAARRLLAVHKTVRVVIRGGTYALTEPLRLASEDSGTRDAPVVWAAYPGEVVRILGSRALPPLQDLPSDSSLPRSVRTTSAAGLGIANYGSPGGQGVELYANGIPLELARWPNRGFTHIAEVSADEPVVVRGTRGSHAGRFIYEGDRPARWSSERDIWLHGYWFWDWADSRSKVQAIDSVAHEIHLAAPLHSYGYRKGQWFYAYNVLVELDRAGEWYLDRETGQIYVWPLSDAELRISVLDTLLELHSTRFVRFEDLDLGEVRDDVIRVTGGESVTFERCKIRNAGGWGVWIDGGAQHAVVGSEIAGTGAGGLRVHGGDRVTLAPAGHVVRGNDIHDFSRWFRTRNPGIDLDGVGNRIEGNHIHDAPHQAIWFHGNDHIIGRNEIDHVCTETIDAGAIYAGRDWTMRGTEIRENYLHDLHGLDDRGCVGIYLDDMFSGTRVTNNILRAVDTGILVGGGRDNIVQNNLIVDCRTGIAVDARALGWAASTLDTLRKAFDQVPTSSEAWRRRYPELARIYDDEPAAPRGNLIAGNAAQRCKLEVIHETARPYVQHEKNFDHIDPGFVDAEHGDLRMRQDSPLRRSGFEPIPFELIGH